jgi:DNA-directed RNA polymerase alpha subunit
MEITIIHKQDNIVHFLVEGVDVAFANALRRTMLTRLPSMAIVSIATTYQRIVTAKVRDVAFVSARLL